MKMGPNKAFEDIGTKACLILNADVGSEYMATARPMDPPQERCEPRRPRGNDFGPKPGTADNNGSQQDVPPYVAQGAPKVNFNVGVEEMI